MGVENLTISREQLNDVITAWELAAARDPSAHTFATPEAKAAHLWQLLSAPRPRGRNISLETSPCL